MSRTLIIGAIGLVALLVALMLADRLDDGPDMEPGETRDVTTALPDRSHPTEPADAGTDSASHDVPGDRPGSGSTTDGEVGERRNVPDPASPADPATRDGEAAEGDRVRNEGRRPSEREPLDRVQDTGSGEGVTSTADIREATSPSAAPEARAAREVAPPPFPTFDVVRVDADGDAVIAGRAAPDAKVRIFRGDVELGQVRADRRGEWVFVPEDAFGAGAHEISLETVGEDGHALRGSEVAVLSMPDREALPESGPKPLVVVSSRDRVAATRIVQRPDPVIESGTAADTLPAPIAAGDTMEPEATGTAAADPAQATDDVPQAAPRVAADEVASRAASGGAAAVVVPRSAEAGRAPTAEVTVVPPAPADTPLAVETIDYDEAGEVAIGGTARPGRRIDLSLDGQPIGEAVVDATGRWEVRPEADVEPGAYSLEARQRGPDGKVEARVMLPFSRAGRIDELPPGEAVIVQPGNSLWRIARRTYGAGIRYTIIYQANQSQIDDPDLIYPGQIFEIPAIQ